MQLLTMKWIESVVLLVFLATVGAIGSFAHAETVQVPETMIASGKGEELNNYMLGLYEKGFHGAVLVAQNGTVFLHNAYGIAQSQDRVPWTTQSPATIGSVTKQFTGAAIMKLEMQGKLSSEDPITKYFQDVSEDKRTMTLHHLLTHSSGLPGHLGRDFDSFSRDDLVSAALNAQLAWEPGTKYRYSNVGYSLLAAVVERITEMSYEQFLRREFFDPLGMQSTGWELPEWDKSKVTRSLDFQPPNSVLDMPDERWHVEGNGGLLSTCADMYRWHLALQGDGVLSKTVREKMFTPWVPEDAEGRSYYGYGWVVQPTRRGGEVIWHNGGGAAGYFAMYRYVKDNAVFIVFSNAKINGRMVNDDVAVTLSQILFGEEYTKPQ